MGFFETLAIAAGTVTTKTAATAVVKKSGSIFWEKILEPRLKARKAKKSIIDGAKKYISKLDKSTKSVTCVAMPSGSALLSEIYVPLSLIRTDTRDLLKLDKYPASLFSGNKRILLTDSAGMGKSTTMKFFVQTALIDLHVLPILVELRKIKPGQTLVGFVSQEFCGSSSEECCAIVGEILDGDSVLLLLDGYDEVEDSLRKIINDEISKISDASENCSIVVASRPDSELKSLTGFVNYMIKPLTEAEAFDLIRNYDKTGENADKLIDKIKSNYQVKEFLGNALMVSLLYKAFNYKNTIPFKRSIFFRQVYDALYQDHDLSKGGGFERSKKTGLDVEDFHKALRALGVSTHMTGTVQYEPERFHYLLQGAQKIAKDISFDAAKFRSDILSAVPVFVREGVEIRWSHKAFQDYFAAHYIYSDAAASLKDQLIDRLIDKENPRRHENVLLILADLDARLVKSRVLLPFFKDLVSGFESSEYVTLKNGFELYQYVKCGEIVAVSEKYKKETLGDEFEGFGDLISKLDYVGGSANFERAHFPGISRGRFVVFESGFLDRLCLINAVSGGRVRARRTRMHSKGYLDKLFAGIEIAEVVALRPHLEESEAARSLDNFKIIASVFDVHFFSEQQARELISEAEVIDEPDIDWLMSMVSSTPH